MRFVFQAFGGFVPRVAALYAALFILPGIQMPFFPVWLKAKDVDAGLIGVVLAVPMVARVLAIPVIARDADRRDAVRDVLIFASVATVVGYILVGLSTGAIAISGHLYTDVTLLHAADAAGGNLCAQRSCGARARLWTGAAVGLVRFYLR